MVEKFRTTLKGRAVPYLDHTTPYHTPLIQCVLVVFTLTMWHLRQHTGRFQFKAAGRSI